MIPSKPRYSKWLVLRNLKVKQFKKQSDDFKRMDSNEKSIIYSNYVKVKLGCTFDELVSPDMILNNSTSLQVMISRPSSMNITQALNNMINCAINGQMV